MSIDLALASVAAAVRAGACPQLSGDLAWRARPADDHVLPAGVLVLLPDGTASNYP